MLGTKTILSSTTHSRHFRQIIKGVGSAGGAVPDLDPMLEKETPSGTVSKVSDREQGRCRTNGVIRRTLTLLSPDDD